MNREWEMPEPRFRAWPGTRCRNWLSDPAFAFAASRSRLAVPTSLDPNTTFHPYKNQASGNPTPIFQVSKGAEPDFLPGTWE